MTDPENPLPPGSEPPSETLPDPLPESLQKLQHSGPNPSDALPGDPISYVATMVQPVEYAHAYVQLPEDLRISWSWWHLFFFICASVASAIFIIPFGLAMVVGAYTHDSPRHLQALFANPGFLIAAQFLLFLALLFFLYITLAVLRDAPFWWTLGWRKLSARAGNHKPWVFFAWGSGLAIFVAVASSRVKGTENAPIEELFKDPHSALLLMAMAVFVAPLVEETVFRGYLYPLFAGGFSRMGAAGFGMDSARAVRFGMTSGILLTGFLFGLLHGSQLGWNWPLVALLTTVGILFTFARATTGTVLASFLMHLGYNSLIAVSSILATKGFQHMPKGH